MQFEKTWKDKNKYHITLLMCAVQKTGTDERICKAEIETQMWRTHGYHGGKRGWDELGDQD